MVDVVQDLGQRAGVVVRLDPKALEEIGVARDEPVTGDYRDVSLAGVLELMLQELDLFSKYSSGSTQRVHQC